MAKKNIIGITGTLASGKDTVADYICQKYGLKSYSTSDEVRYEATERGLDHSRANMIQIATEIRTNLGLGELARRALERVPAADKVALVTSIRNLGEIEYLKEHSDFSLISVDGPIEMRYERAKKRGRIGDGQNFEDFRELEEKELYGTASPQLIPCMRAADFFILNDGTLEELHIRTDEVIKAIINK